MHYVLDSVISTIGADGAQFRIKCVRIRIRWIFESTVYSYPRALLLSQLTY